MPLRIFHLSDLHIGKRVHEFSMISDQKYILEQITQLASEYRPHAVIIAGDVYDKPLPPAEAVSLLDSFLTDLSKMGIKVFVISGNHDSAERVSFASRLLNASGIYISHAFDGSVQSFKAEGEGVSANVYLLPFVRPVNVSQAFEVPVSDYTQAVKLAVEKMNVDSSEINILAAHQFVTGAQTCDSEEINVGGLDNVSAEVFEAFDYTALGHIHTSQNITPKIRYCGTPLKYSFSEKAQKSVTMLTINGKNNISAEYIPLVPKREMRTISETFESVTEKAVLDDRRDDYLQITLTDDDFIPDALPRLRAYYPNIMLLNYDNERTRQYQREELLQTNTIDSPLDMLKKLFKIQNNKEMDETQQNYISELINKVWRGEEQ